MIDTLYTLACLTIRRKRLSAGRNGLAKPLVGKKIAEDRPRTMNMNPNGKSRII